jgi:hypothetical protein
MGGARHRLNGTGSRRACSPGGAATLLAAIVLLAAPVSAVGTGLHAPRGGENPGPTPSPVSNFTDAINRLVELVSLAGAGILALVWARVAFSWFSNDITKKVQAKDRARDALVGTLLFVAAITGLIWGLAQWVLTGV